MIEPISAAGILTAGSVIVATKLLKDVVSKCAAATGTKLSKKFKALLAANRIGQLYDKISSLRNVKTIWQREKEVDLHAFYYPTRVKFGDSSLVVRSIEKLPEAGRNIVLQGTVGLGKSIFLRYLGSSSFQTGTHLPLFVELRNRTADRTFESLLLERLERLGFSPDKETLTALLATGQVLILCDGFDEIEEQVQSDAVNELEHYCECFPCRVLVTARPEAAICSSPSFRIVRLSPLETDDIYAIVRRLDEGGEDAETLIKELKQSNSPLLDVVKTPLMATLLLVSFKAS